MKMKYKADLERLLSRQLFSKEPGPFCQATVSDKGEFVILDVGYKQTKRKLSPHGKEYLRTGNFHLGPGESFLEPEE